MKVSPSNFCLLAEKRKIPACCCVVGCTDNSVMNPELCLLYDTDLKNGAFNKTKNGYT